MRITTFVIHYQACDRSICTCQRPDPYIELRYINSGLLLFQIKNKVPSTLNRDAWENQTINRLEDELKHKSLDWLWNDGSIREKVHDIA